MELLLIFLAIESKTYFAILLSLSLKTIMSNDSQIKILFVCYGNTCRSPMAEAVLRDLLKKRNLENKLFIRVVRPDVARHRATSGDVYSTCRPTRRPTREKRFFYLKRRPPRRPTPVFRRVGRRRLTRRATRKVTLNRKKCDVRRLLPLDVSPDASPDFRLDT